MSLEGADLAMPVHLSVWLLRTINLGEIQIEDGSFWKQNLVENSQSFGQITNFDQEQMASEAHMLNIGLLILSHKGSIIRLYKHF